MPPTKYRLFRRRSTYYLKDKTTGRQTSLRTKNKQEAQTLLASHNEAQRQTFLNLQIARAYLMASDPAVTQRTWQDAFTSIVETKTGATHERWLRARNDPAFDPIRQRVLLETQAEELLAVMKSGKVSTNVYLRRVHNFALDLNWLPAPIIPKRQWPGIKFKEKRAITLEEHQRVVAREPNPERRAYYELAWHLGAAQGDLAALQAEDVDWEQRVITFERKKLAGKRVDIPQVAFGEEVATVLRRLPKRGPLFPYLITVRSGDRATEFAQRCKGLGIKGVTLHSYRYAWAERAKVAGYPERFAQAALGHNSKAVHRAYARRAKVLVPTLEDYEKAHRERKIVPFHLQREQAAETPPAHNKGST